MYWRCTAALRRAWLPGLIAAALLPGALSAQPFPGEAQLRLTPLELLLEEREALGLTPEQVARIEEIRQRLEQRNAPLVQRLVVLRAAWHNERAALERAGRRQSPRLQQLRQRSEPIFRQVQQNNRMAMARASQVLVVEQRQRLRERIEARRPPNSHGG